MNIKPKKERKRIMGTIIGEGITFDDVLLVPAYSQVIPNQVDLTTYLLPLPALQLTCFCE